MNAVTSLSAAAATLLLWATLGNAVVQPVVGFTNSQLGATINLRAVTNYGHYGGSGAIMDERYLVEYSDAVPLLANQSGYSGVDIYGGRVRTQFDTTDSMYNILNNANNGAGMNFRIYSYNNVTYQLATLFYVKKGDFAGTGSTMPVTITDDSAFSVRFGSEQYGGGDMRCVVRIGSQLYASQATSNIVTAGSPGTTYTFSGLASSLWAAYDPAANIYFDAASATFEALTLTNIQAAGIIVNRTGTGQHNYHWKAYQLDVAADVIPEPAVAVVAALAGVCLARRRG